MNRKKLEELSKEQLIKLVQQLQEETGVRGITEEESYRMEEEHMQNEAYMESHGKIDYGYGCGIYGPL